MAKWKVTFESDSRIAVMEIEADEATWPFTEGPADGAVQFANRIEPKAREDHGGNVTMVSDFELVAFVNTRHLVSVERMVGDYERVVED